MGRLSSRVLVLALLLAASLCAGCGGGSSVTPPPPPAPDFSLNLSTNSISVSQGATSSAVSVSISPINGFTGNVHVTLSGLPSGVTSNPASPFEVMASGSVSVVFGATSSAATGNFTVSAQGALERYLIRKLWLLRYKRACPPTYRVQVTREPIPSQWLMPPLPNRRIVKNRYAVAGVTPIPNVIFDRPIEALPLSNGEAMVRLRQPASAQALLALWNPVSGSFSDLTSAAPAVFQNGVGALARISNPDGESVSLDAAITTN